MRIHIAVKMINLDVFEDSTVATHTELISKLNLDIDSVIQKGQIINGNFESMEFGRQRRIMICPVGNRSAVNQALDKIGYGPDNFSIPLTNNPGSVVTAYASDWGGMTDGDVVKITNVLKGINNAIIIKDGVDLGVIDRFEKTVSENNFKQKRS